MESRPMKGFLNEYVILNKGSRKLNYICSMNPTTLSSLSGTITDLGGINPIFLDTDMFLAEFVIVARD